MRLLRHDGIYRSDVSLQLVNPVQMPPPVGRPRYRAIGRAGRNNTSCPSSAMSSGRLFLDRGGRHQSPSPLHRHPQNKPLAFRRASIYHRTASSVLTVCVSRGDKRNPPANSQSIRPSQKLWHAACLTPHREARNEDELRRRAILILAMSALSVVAHPPEPRVGPQGLTGEAIRNNPEIVAAQKTYEAARQRPTQESCFSEKRFGCRKTQDSFVCKVLTLVSKRR